MLAAIRTAFAVLAAAVAISASAALITYEFSVTAIFGPLAGVTETGTFTFDSASIVPGGNNLATGLLTDLDFTWNGIHYDESTANTGALGFDSAGELINATLGTDCFPGGCGLNQGGVESWLIGASSSIFAYATVGAQSGFGDVTLSRVTAVPEPASLALVGLALVIGVAVRRAKRNVQTTRSNALRKAAVAAFASLVMVSAADAVVYRSVWDPQFSVAFSAAEGVGGNGVGWRGTAFVTVDDGCLVPGSDWGPGIPDGTCTSAVLNSVFLTMYDLVTDVTRFNFGSVGVPSLQPLSEVSIDGAGDVDGVTFTSAITGDTFTSTFSQLYGFSLNMTLGGPTLTLTEQCFGCSDVFTSEFPPTVIWTRIPERIPEPTSLALIGIALGALGLSRRRKT